MNYAIMQNKAANLNLYSSFTLRILYFNIKTEFMKKSQLRLRVLGTRSMVNSREWVGWKCENFTINEI